MKIPINHIMFKSNWTSSSVDLKLSYSMIDSGVSHLLCIFYYQQILFEFSSHKHRIEQITRYNWKFTFNQVQFNFDVLLYFYIPNTNNTFEFGKIKETIPFRPSSVWPNRRRFYSIPKWIIQNPFMHAKCYICTQTTL